MDNLEYKGSSVWRGPRTVVAATLAVLLVSNAYVAWRAHELARDVQRLRASSGSEMAELRENYESSSSNNSRTLKLLVEELTAVRLDAVSAAGKARTDAQRHAERLARRIEQAQRERAARIDRMATELDEVKSSATTTQASLASVSTQVTATKSMLTTASSDLRRVNGDLGVLSDRVATNAAELAALKQLGDRNYTEFDLRRSAQPQRVGDISVVLKKADAKRNRFTIDVLADDKRVEKKDRTINEPVQFYVSKVRQPYELVVNEVRRDRVIGYLAAPKAGGGTRLAAR